MSLEHLDCHECGVSVEDVDTHECAECGNNYCEDCGTLSVPVDGSDEPRFQCNGCLLEMTVTAELVAAAEQDAVRA